MVTAGHGRSGCYRARRVGCQPTSDRRGIASAGCCVRGCDACAHLPRLVPGEFNDDLVHLGKSPHSLRPATSETTVMLDFSRVQPLMATLPDFPLGLVSKGV